MFACSCYSYLISSYNKRNYETAFNFVFNEFKEEKEVFKYIEDISDFIFTLYFNNNIIDDENVELLIKDVYNYFTNCVKNNCNNKPIIDDNVNYYNYYTTFITTSFTTSDDLKENINVLKNKLLSLGYNENIVHKIIITGLINILM